MLGLRGGGFDTLSHGFAEKGRAQDMILTGLYFSSVVKPYADKAAKSIESPPTVPYGGAITAEPTDTPPACGKEATGKLVLVAEDNDSNYLLLHNIMKHRYTTIRAVDGAEAVRLHSELAPDLILMDIKMPVMDGLEATARIRLTDPDTPIIALTAYAFEEEQLEALDAGCNMVLTKPVDVACLRALLAELLCA